MAEDAQRGCRKISGKGLMLRAEECELGPVSDEDPLARF